MSLFASLMVFSQHPVEPDDAVVFVGPADNARDAFQRAESAHQESRALVKGITAEVPPQLLRDVADTIRAKRKAPPPCVASGLGSPPDQRFASFVVLKSPETQQPTSRVGVTYAQGSSQARGQAIRLALQTNRTTRVMNAFVFQPSDSTVIRLANNLPKDD